MGRVTRHRSALSAAAVVVIAMASTTAGTQASGASPQLEPAAEVTGYDRPRVLVWTLDGSRMNEGELASIAASVTRWVAHNPHLEVISAAEMASLLDVEANRAMLGLPDEGQLKQLAEQAHANLIIFGRADRRRDHLAVQLQLFESRAGRAVHREQAVLSDVAAYDKELGRAAASLVGRVLPLPALEPRELAAMLIDQLPNDVFTTDSSSVTTMKPFTWQSTRFTSPIGERFAAEVNAAIRRRGGEGRLSLRAGLSLVGTYLAHEDMVETSLTVIDATRNVAPPKSARAADLASPLPLKVQARMIRASVDDDDILPRRLGKEARERAEHQAASVRERAGLVVDAFTEKGRLEVTYTEGEVFHVYLKMNRPGYIRLVYRFADGTRVLMQDAWPMTVEQTGQVVRYGQAFGPAAPFGVEKIEVYGFEKRPPAPTTTFKTIAGTRYELLEGDRGFVVQPRSQTEITLITSAR